MWLFKCRHVVNADTLLSQSAGETKDSVINIPWLHLLACIIWSLLTLVQKTHTHTLMPGPTHTILPLCCLASSAEGRLDAGRGSAPHYSLVRWPKGEMKNSPVVLIPKTLNTLILSSLGALLLASSAAMATGGYKTISGVVVKAARTRASETQNTRFITATRQTCGPLLNSSYVLP